MTPLPLLANRLLEKDPMPQGGYDTALVWRWMLSVMQESFHGVRLQKQVPLGGMEASWTISGESLWWQEHFWCRHQQRWRTGEDVLLDDFANETLPPDFAQAVKGRATEVCAQIRPDPATPFFLDDRNLGPAFSMGIHWARAFLPRLMEAPLDHALPQAFTLSSPSRI